MESKRIPRKSKKNIKIHSDSTALTIQSPESTAKEPSNTVVLERERWCSQTSNNNYEKVRLSLGASTCFKKEIVRHGFYLSIIISMISLFFIWTYTLHKVHNLEDQMEHIEQQILTNIKSIKEHHNSTFKELEEKHNELKDLVNIHSMIISSKSWTISKDTFDFRILFVHTLLLMNIIY